MKRIFILLVASLLLFVGAVFAEESVLIDFSLLTADLDNGQNRQTVMDYGQVAGASFTQDQRAAMKTSLAIENWDVFFTASSRTIATISNSFTREAPSRQWGTVMGVRVHFPLENFYSKATIRPPFEIPAFEPLADIDNQGNIQPTGSNGITGPSRFEDGFGIVKNVGTIRSVAVNVYGLNFPHALYVLLVDDLGNERAVFMGYLNFDGWAELTWNNPQYIFDVRDRELRLYPLYPNSMPFVRFAGFRIDRDADAVGGDFIGYFKDVKLIYDKAVLDVDRDIDDEALWNIIRDRETGRRIREMERFGQLQIQRHLDYERQAREAFDPLFGTNVQERYGFTPTPTLNQ